MTKLKEMTLEVFIEDFFLRIIYIYNFFELSVLIKVYKF